MAAFEISGTNHTSFTVSDLDRAVGFYRDLLGFELTSRAGRDPDVIAHVTGVAGAEVDIAYLSGHGHTVELIEYKAPDDRKLVDCRPCDTGFAHLAFDVKGLQSLVAAAAKYGFRPLGPPLTNRTGGPNQGMTVVYMRDGDGVTIELIEPPS